MRRRTFIQTLSLAAVGSATSVQSKATGQAQSSEAATAAELPPFQAAGAERFIRPDVHAGDRPSGASFTTRSPALGLNGAAGTAHPLATQTAIEMLKRGGSAVDAAVAANAVLGFVEPVSSGLGGDCFAFVWDPKVGKLMAWPAPAGRQNLFRLQQRVRAPSMATFRRSAPSLFPRPARSTDGGRCTSATASSSGPSSSSQQSLPARTAIQRRKSLATTSSAIWRRFSVPTRALKRRPTLSPPTCRAASRPTNTMCVAIPTWPTPIA